MSGYSEDYYPEALALSGFDGILVKPFTIRELAASLSRLVPSD
jgi:DNA-binding response OmpR family regulator